MDKAKRLKALAGYKEIFDLYLRRPMTTEEQQIFDDCMECKISFDEYKDRLIQITIEQGKKLTNLFTENNKMNKKAEAV
ncbi:hypothetical protein SAMN02910357_02212 [Succinivibrio dextrinosolvens]|uniref:hypothetical protein n=1 Tax=Succinivibrio dextrinosolvens TaxID=83771 RepID=UPI0008EEBFE2|nr:hypothetical protein [Succinivibrio dextrinosolvens]SFS84865.1 hypothetical protein SAMN02910357_02212 [Succinivibrio dextrinosolvens]